MESEKRNWKWKLAQSNYYLNDWISDKSPNYSMLKWINLKDLCCSGCLLSFISCLSHLSMLVRIGGSHWTKCYRCDSGQINEYVCKLCASGFSFNLWSSIPHYLLQPISQERKKCVGVCVCVCVREWVSVWSYRGWQRKLITKID